MDNSRPMKDSRTADARPGPPAEAEVKSGVMLPVKVSELRWKLGQKAKQPEGRSFYAHLQALGLRFL